MISVINTQDLPKAPGCCHWEAFLLYSRDGRESRERGLQWGHEGPGSPQLMFIFIRSAHIISAHTILPYPALFVFQYLETLMQTIQPARRQHNVSYSDNATHPWERFINTEYWTSNITYQYCIYGSGINHNTPDRESHTTPLSAEDDPTLRCRVAGETPTTWSLVTGRRVSCVTYRTRT